MAKVYRRKQQIGWRAVEYGKYKVKFRDPSGVWRTLAGYTDRRASEELRHKLERLSSLRAAGEQPDPTLGRWMEGLSNSLRDRLAAWGVLDGRSVAGSKPLMDHVADYRQALLDGVASPRQRGPAMTKHADMATRHVELLLAGIGPPRSPM